jgi:hypothetical protein
LNRNKHKRKKEKPPRKTAMGSSDRFWKTREELFLVLELREEKVTFALIEGGKNGFFFHLQMN